MCACCRWGSEDTEARKSPSCWSSCTPVKHHVQCAMSVTKQTDVLCQFVYLCLWQTFIMTDTVTRHNRKVAGVASKINNIVFYCIQFLTVWHDGLSENWATKWNSAKVNFIIYTCSFSSWDKMSLAGKGILKLQTHKAVCIQRSSAASSTLDVATLARASTKAPAVTLRGAHSLCHWKRDGDCVCSFQLVPSFVLMGALHSCFYLAPMPLSAKNDTMVIC